ncbi:sugar kinase [Clostridium tertium]|uniref:2-dehydro-3-deoxygluconokinase n=1 Tax=Clostridium tertium TaxID=1559 RepID=A0A6N3BJR5_9CLOT
MDILAFGEVMMRLMPPDYKLLTQSESLNFLYTGTGVNILSGLYQMGNNVYLATTLPDNNVGYAAAANLRKLGIRDDCILFKNDYLGIYFLEMGIGDRASRVTYMNRKDSSFAKSTIEDYEIENLLEGKSCLHLCGIALSMNENVRNLVYTFAKKAKEKKLKVIFDCNFRVSLWKEKDKEIAREEYEKILRLSDIVFAGEKDGELLLGIKAPEDLKENDKTKFILNSMRKKYNIDIIFGTKRRNKDKKQFLQGYLLDDHDFIISNEYELTIYDRVGAGDGFAAGAIHGILHNFDKKEIIEFATCSGVLAHTTYGDSPLLGVEDIQRFMNNKHIDLIR